MDGTKKLSAGMKKQEARRREVKKQEEHQDHVKEKRSYVSPYDVNNVPFFLRKGAFFAKQSGRWAYTDELIYENGSKTVRTCLWLTSVQGAQDVNPSEKALTFECRETF